MVRLLPHLGEGKHEFKIAKSFVSVNKNVEEKN
jgi:hypothetical protein